jgi:hypothetical protein
MGTSAGVVGGSSAGADINHDPRKSLANPRAGDGIMLHQSLAI